MEHKDAIVTKPIREERKKREEEKAKVAEDKAA